VVLTAHAARMVAPVTFQALSGNTVITSLFEGSADPSITHVELAKWEDVLAVAPATANVLGKFARGIADDFLSTHYLASTAPVVLAPAMNGNMWRHPAVRENLDILSTRGHRIVPPAKGLLACGDVDEGRLPEPALLAEEIVRLAPERDLAGVPILVTAGPTREALDPVRYLTNRSSGRMGFALAAEAARRGAEVTLVAGAVDLATPPGVRRIDASTGAEMREAVLVAFRSARVLIMTAAVADYAPAEALPRKRKKGDGPWTLELKKTPDILREASEGRSADQLVIGFAAETEEVEAGARRKLEEKNLDAVCANDVSGSDSGFDVDRNALLLVRKHGSAVPIGPDSKAACSRAILDALAEMIHGR